jgi:hypothetical protein
MKWTCGCCGAEHDSLPLAYGPSAPALVATIPEAERGDRVLLSSDLCVVDAEHFFIVGNLELPIIGTEQHFSWDAWVSLSKHSFERTCELWDSVGRESEPPYFGWLSSSLPGYPETLSLKTHVRTRSVGRRPFIELEPTDHPLAVEQRSGITMHRIQQIAETVLHGGSSDP